MKKSLFHVHTYRCGHASNEKDEEYVKKAIELGAKEIVFTDHAPFPGDPFFDRMKYNELNEYVNSLRQLKEKYKDQIDVKIGLEIEYIPSYLGYYQSLKESKMFDMLMIGQHFYEIWLDKYSFNLDIGELIANEFIGCGEAIIEGINTGYFNVVAHPDRIFRKREFWSESMESMANKIIEAAKQNSVLLEVNASSKKHYCQYWEEFWKSVPENMIVYGLDAHSTEELKILD